METDSDKAGVSGMESVEEGTGTGKVETGSETGTCGVFETGLSGAGVDADGVEAGDGNDANEVKDY
ncbi:hypothetical protein C0995_014611 [Termitomyces sp. Mi166|nr:hypothetical protein C0995_014611 [Termitomyces sp. Mi166\